MPIVRPFLSALAALSFVGAASLGGEASAVPVDTAVVLNLDSSGSISSDDYTLQAGAYASLLQAVATDGSLAIGVKQFSSSVQDVFPLQQINDEADRSALVDAISGLSQIGGSTDIAGAIDLSTADLTSLGVDCGLTSIACLIDVSTDGRQTLSGNPDASAAASIAAGVDQVNCLGVGRSFDCGFVAGTDAFTVNADSFDDFQRALNEKLGREGVIDEMVGDMDPGDMDIDTGGPDADGMSPAVIPLPAGALLLLGGLGGLAGVGVARRR